LLPEQADARTRSAAARRQGSPLLKKLSDEVARIIQSKAVQENLTAQGADPVCSSPAEFGAFITAETNRYAKVVRDAGVKAE
jgi:tripartite-type tricarboxylate transporter receptor subunit TctC